MASPSFRSCFFADDNIAVGPRTVLGLAFPASLTKLELLSPVEAGVLSLVPRWLKHLPVDCAGEGPVEGHGSFLSCMAKLPHLTQLELSPTGLDWPVAGPAYSALTASSNLVYFRMVVTSFPTGVWPYIFPCAHKLPHLTQLRVVELDVGDGLVVSLRWGASDLSSLVNCCPGLCCIDTLSLQPGLHVSVLHKLTALTRVHVWLYADNVATVDASVRGLAAVTQLQVLRMTTDVPDITVASLLPLTNLTALTKLHCSWYTAEGQHGDWANIRTQVRLPSYGSIMNLAMNIKVFCCRTCEIAWLFQCQHIWLTECQHPSCQQSILSQLHCCDLMAWQRLAVVVLTYSNFVMLCCRPALPLVSG